MWWTACSSKRASVRGERARLCMLPAMGCPGVLSHSSAAPYVNAGGEGAQGSVVIKFWRNGFTVDDGDVRSMEEPANRAFLDSLDKGCVAL